SDLPRLPDPAGPSILAAPCEPAGAALRSAGRPGLQSRSAQAVLDVRPGSNPDTDGLQRRRLPRPAWRGPRSAAGAVPALVGPRAPTSWRNPGRHAGRLGRVGAPGCGAQSERALELEDGRLPGRGIEGG